MINYEDRCIYETTIHNILFFHNILKVNSMLGKCNLSRYLQPTICSNVFSLSLTYLSASSRICAIPKYFLKCSKTLTTPCNRLATSPYCLFLVKVLGYKKTTINFLFQLNNVARTLQYKSSKLNKVVDFLKL